MTDSACYKIRQRWEGDEQAPRLFADLSVDDDAIRFVPRRPDPPEPWPQDVTFEFEGDTVDDVPYQVFGWPLFSERLKTMVEISGLTGITFYPIRVVTKSLVLPRYWYAHLRHLEKAIDFDKSDYSVLQVHGSELLTMLKFTLRASAVSGWDFFRTSESPSTRFCSARFRRLFQEMRGSGIEFQPVPIS